MIIVLNFRLYTIIYIFTIIYYYIYIYETHLCLLSRFPANNSALVFWAVNHYFVNGRLVLFINRIRALMRLFTFPRKSSLMPLQETFPSNLLGHRVGWRYKLIAALVKRVTGSMNHLISSVLNPSITALSLANKREKFLANQLVPTNFCVKKTQWYGKYQLINFWTQVLGIVKIFQRVPNLINFHIWNLVWHHFSHFQKKCVTCRCFFLEILKY